MWSTQKDDAKYAPLYLLVVRLCFRCRDSECVLGDDTTQAMSNKDDLAGFLYAS